MKKVVHGKIFDTNTADLIFEFTEKKRDSENEPIFSLNKLYVTKNKRFFRTIEIYKTEDFSHENLDIWNIYVLSTEEAIGLLEHGSAPVELFLKYFQIEEG